MSDPTQPPLGPDATQDEIEADIIETRARLAESVDALADKMDVKARAQDKVEDVKATAQDKVAEVKAAAQEKVAAVRATAQEKVLGVKTTAQEKVAEVKAAAQDKVASVKGSGHSTTTVSEPFDGSSATAVSGTASTGTASTGTASTGTASTGTARADRVSGLRDTASAKAALGRDRVVAGSQQVSQRVKTLPQSAQIALAVVPPLVALVVAVVGRRKRVQA